MRRLASIAAACAMLLVVRAPAAAEPPLDVVTRSVPPFAFQDADGRWQGIAIELFERTAADLGREFRYREVTLKEMLAALADGQADVAVGALSVTAEREAMFDFTHAFFRTGLGIAVPNQPASGWDRSLRALLAPGFLGMVGAGVALLLIVGFLVWLLERRRNDHFPADPVRGIGAGFWWSSVTMTTVGYGDKAPATFAGRALAIVWMFASVVLISLVTASLTSSLTVEALAGDVKGESDLRRARTGTVAGSTSEARLARKGYASQPYPDLGAALADLAANKLDAVVYDQPLLRYQVKTTHADRLSVLPVTFEPQEYAFGLPNASPLRKRLNRSLLAHSHGDEWEARVTRYLGATP